MQAFSVLSNKIETHRDDGLPRLVAKEKVRPRVHLKLHGAAPDATPRKQKQNKIDKSVANLLQLRNYLFEYFTHLFSEAFWQHFQHNAPH